MLIETSDNCCSSPCKFILQFEGVWLWECVVFNLLFVLWKKVGCHEPVAWPFQVGFVANCTDATAYNVSCFCKQTRCLSTQGRRNNKYSTREHNIIDTVSCSSAIVLAKSKALLSGEMFEVKHESSPEVPNFCDQYQELCKLQSVL